jgi:hypothetical protein
MTRRKKGTGSIYYTQGKWQLRWRDREGQPKSALVNVRSRDAAERELQKRIQAEEQPLKETPSPSSEELLGPGQKGSLRQKPNSIWEFRYYDEAGERQYLYAKSLEKLKEKRQQIRPGHQLVPLALPSEPPGTDVTLMPDGRWRLRWKDKNANQRNEYILAAGETEAKQELAKRCSPTEEKPVTSVQKHRSDYTVTIRQKKSGSYEIRYYLDGKRKSQYAPTAELAELKRQNLLAGGGGEALQELYALKIAQLSAALEALKKEMKG